MFKKEFYLYINNKIIHSNQLSSSENYISQPQITHKDILFNLIHSTKCGLKDPNEIKLLQLNNQLMTNKLISRNKKKILKNKN